MSPYDRLVQHFENFPGIGPRQAGRFARFFLKGSKSFQTDFIKTLQDAGQSIARCTMCMRFFPKNTSETCDICNSPRRDQSLILIVSDDPDIEAFERAKTYRGTYFVIGGLLPLLKENPYEYLRMEELKIRLSKLPPKEIILALPATTEGDHTSIAIRHALEALYKDNYRISLLARGLSTGTEIEYADPSTIEQAFLNRK